MLSPVQWLFAGLLVLCLLLLAVLIALVSAGNRRARRIPRRILDELGKLEDDLADQDARQREELTRNLYQMNESLVNTFGSVSRGHADQVNALIRQSHESNQSFDLRQQEMQRMLDERLRRMEGRMETLRQSTEENLRLLREDNDQKLSEMRRTVDEKLNDTLEKRLSASFSQVSERLEQVYRSLGEMHTLASGVG
ncbi:MAG: hypothetical protein SOZ54_07785, partial [Candidatus Limiplasma sp.]|nr:hypothetical protein [Candidatus Limiplasma sp.]